MKAVKILLKVIVVIVLLVVVALLALPLWFGPVVKTAANAVVPDIVKTDFNLGHLHLNPYTARFELGDMQLSNPAGYSEKYAATLGDIIFDAEALSLASDTIHIEEITVKNVFVSLVSGGENKVDNFKQIQYNIAGGKEKYEAAEAEKAKAAEEEKIRLDGLKDQASAKDEKPAEKPAEKAEEKPSKKVVIDKLHISGLKVKYGFVPISVPVTIELSDIGKDSGGATFEEAWQQIWAGILKAAGVTGEQLKALGNLTGDAARQATAAATKAASQATAAMGSAAEGAGKMASQATDALGDAAKGATDALGGAGQAASDATKKVGDAAGKALDSIKNLW